MLSNFPSGMQTAETVWLFLQAVMARLERQKGSRCAIVVPNSVLFDKGIGARVKAELMTRFNLHTVLRMPNGVFAPYTLIPSNILFFERGQQSEHIWFYEHPRPRDARTTPRPDRWPTRSSPREAWWGGAARQGRVETERAWRVAVADVVAEDYDLDRRNPNRPDDLAHRPPRNSSRNLSRPNATCWRSWNSSSTKSGTSPDDASSSRPFG